MGGDPVPVVVSVEVEGDRLVIDLEGTGPQGRGALNVPKIALSATVYYCVKALLDPELLANQGLIDAIEIRAPEGCIVNPRHPAAVGARSITCQKVAGAVFGALARRAAAGTADRLGQRHPALPAAVRHTGRRQRDLCLGGKRWAAAPAHGSIRTAWMPSTST